MVHVLLLAVGDLSRHPWWTLGLLGGGFVALWWSIVPARATSYSASAVLGLAIVLRLLLLPLAPTLSDDVLRYMWDGKVVNAGENPYRLAPEAAQLEPLRDADWQRMPHRDVEAVYPPVPLALFSIAAATPAPLWAWKSLLVACELLGCALLLRLAARLGIPPGRVALYAWNPLVTLEVAGMAHVDALGVTLVIATVWALMRGRLWAPAAAAGAVLVKMVPIIALPIWARHARRSTVFGLVSAGLVALILAPLVLAVGGPPPGWVRFGVSWEFNGPLYEPLWRGIAALELDSTIKLGLDQLKTWTGAHELGNRFYPWVYPQLMAKALLGLLLLGLLWRVWRDRELHVTMATGRTFAAIILCSATVYPWYLLWMLPWAALAGQRAWLALSGLILLSYLPQFAGVELIPWLFVIIWLPFAVLLWRYRSWSIG